MATTDELRYQILAAQTALDDTYAQYDRSKAQTSEAYAAYQEAIQAPAGLDSYIFNGQVFDNKADYVSAAYINYNIKKDETSDLLSQLDIANEELDNLQKDLGAAEDVTSTIKTPSATNESQSDLETQDQYEFSSAEDAVDSSDSLSDAIQPFLKEFGTSYGERSVPGVSPGAEIPKKPEIKTTIRTAVGDKGGKDLRVKIRVPTSYLVTELTSGPNKGLGDENIGGIIFPYTPTINFDLKSDYTSVNPLHSNFSINFYKSSSITSINLSGKFTVENDKDAGFYMATVHLLRSLTRMRFGLDWDKGAPPPVCRLDAYGKMMLKNVPVVITNFKIDLPDSVDYYTTGSKEEQISVPTISTISITCLPMYSRKEMQEFSVFGYLTGKYKDEGII